MAGYREESREISQSLRWQVELNSGDQRLIYSLCKYLRPRRILEVGTHIGASSIHIALASKMNGDSCELTPSTFEMLTVRQQCPGNRRAHRLAQQK